MDKLPMKIDNVLDDIVLIVLDGHEPLKELGKHPDDNQNISLFKGRYGLYIKYKGLNFGLPKSTDPENVSIKDVINIIKKKKKR